MTFQGLIDMWTSIMCPTTRDSTFHDFKCLQGECFDCGIDMLVTCPIEEDNASDKLMKWKCYEKVLH
jgi:hypothetical protein